MADVFDPRELEPPIMGALIGIVHALSVVVDHPAAAAFPPDGVAVSVYVERMPSALVQADVARTLTRFRVTSVTYRVVPRG